MDSQRPFPVKHVGMLCLRRDATHRLTCLQNRCNPKIRYHPYDPFQCRRPAYRDFSVPWYLSEMRSRNEVPTGPKEELFVLAIPMRVATGSPSLNIQRSLECSSVDDGRSIVPNRSELEATAAGKTKQPKSRKTPPLARRRGAIGDNGSTLEDASDGSLGHGIVPGARRSIGR